MGELLQIHQLAFQLKRERERQQLTLAELASRSGIDQGALSRLENGRNANPPLVTTRRVAAALGKAIYYSLQDAPQGPSELTPL